MKKFIAIIVALVIMSMTFVACEKPSEGDNNTDSLTNENTDKAADDSEPAGKTELVMATDANFPPYEFYQDGKVVGIDVDIATAIAEKLGMTLKVSDMKFESIITSVQGGSSDIGMAGMTVDPDRLESVDFSISYATGVQVIIVKEDSAIASVDDLAGKKIGVQLMTTGDMYAAEDFGEENVKKYDSGADAVEALKGGAVDAVIIDNQPALSFVEVNPGLKILKTEYAVEEYAIAVAKGNTELLNKINKALEDLIADGTVDTIISKYIKAE